MHKLHFLFVLLAATISFGQSVGWDFTAPSGEDIGMVINGGSGPSTQGLIVGGDGQIYEAVTGIGMNGGKGVLGSNATGLVADGYHSYPAVVANQHGTATGVSASGYTAGVFGFASGPNDPAGVHGDAMGGLYPSGVKGTATTNTTNAYFAGVTGIGTTGTQPMNSWGVRAAGVGMNLTSPNDNAVGVYATADGAGGLNYGIYASATPARPGATYAGFFNGNVNVTGSCACSPSDEKLKTNVRPLEKGLNTVLALKPKTYDMKVEEYKDRIILADGPQVGLIAQDVEKLMPELVTKVLVPRSEPKSKDGTMDTSPSMDYKTLNYVGLIPVLIKAIQEQEAKIQALERKLANR